MGCDYLFQIHEIPSRPDAPACTPIGHDEDGDDLDDACDPCPFDGSNGGDEDDDGIADACDPDPMKNDVLLFSGLSPRAATQFETTGGGFTNDAFRYVGQDSAALLWGHGLDRIWVVAGVDVTSVTSAAPFREVGIIFDADTAGARNQPDGTYCIFGQRGADNSHYLQIFARARPSSDMVVEDQSPMLALVDLRAAQVRAYYARTEVPGTSCLFTTGQDAIQISGTRTSPPPAGRLALYALGVGVDFTYLFVVRRR